MTTREITLFGGPCDGVRMQWESTEALILCQVPEMSAQEFLARHEPFDPEPGQVAKVQYAYLRDPLADWRYTYVGERVV